MDIHVSKQGNKTLIIVQGRVDSGNASEFGQALMNAIDAGHLNIVLDLEDVPYMSSAGLREIVVALKSIRRSNGSLCVKRASEVINGVMSMSGLDTAVKCEDDL